jgi:fluoride exporter
MVAQSIIVGIGGIFGAISRFAIEHWVSEFTKASVFPFGTLTVNILGCLIIGMLFALIEDYGSISPRLRLLLITGFLGALTTFSSFGLDTFNLIQKNHLIIAIINILVQVVFGLIAVWLGFVITRIIGGTLIRIKQARYKRQRARRIRPKKSN